MKKPHYISLASGRILGLVLVLFLLVFSVQINTSGQTLSTLYSFSGFDGSRPSAALIQANDGNFYGTTKIGGRTDLNNGLGYGTIFRISPTGNLTNLWLFTGGTDGGLIAGGVLQGKTGDFYGTTDIGGTSTNCPLGCGTVFKISPSGSLTSLYSFGKSDGAFPRAGLVQGNDGYFYGTTSSGGAHNGGTAFRISTTGALTTLWSFCSAQDCFDGVAPMAGLVQGIDGDLYGTTHGGGTFFQGVGTVFRVSSSGNFTSLWSFDEMDGDSPFAALVQGSDGNFYGTTFSGGTGPAGGNVFRYTPSGSLTSLCSFGYSNGGYPVAGLVQGTDGNFYGVNSELGASNAGTVFQVIPNGGLTTLYTFTGGNDGAAPAGILVQGSDGSFYGTTSAGGSSMACTQGCGTVFKLVVPLSPPPYPINQITNTQIATTNVVFDVVSVAGETYQLQFSSSMNPTNWVNVPGASVTNSIGALLTVTNFGGTVGLQGFYRFDITP